MKIKMPLNKNKFKLKPEQATIINQLSNELDMTGNEIVYFLIEMGIGCTIACRKGKETDFLGELEKKTIEDKTLNRLAQRLEAFWDAAPEY